MDMDSRFEWSKHHFFLLHNDTVYLCCIYIVILFYPNMPLTNRDKIIIGYTAVMDFLNELDKNKGISASYKSTMFGRLFVLLQTHFFPTANPGEAQKFIEDANIIRTQMKALLSETIIAASKATAGGFGVDRPLEVGQQDDIGLSSGGKQQPEIQVNKDELIDQMISFHEEAVKMSPYDDALRLITNQSMKIRGIKGMQREEVEKLVVKRLKVYGKEKNKA